MIEWRVRDCIKQILIVIDDGWISLGRPKLAAHSTQTYEQKENTQLPLFSGQDNQLLKRIGDIDISSITPLEAMIELDKLKKIVDGLKR